MDTITLQSSTKITTYDVSLVHIPQTRRGQLIDILMKNWLGELSIQDATSMTIGLPKKIYSSISLADAVSVELIFETYGAIIDICPSTQQR